MVQLTNSSDASQKLLTSLQEISRLTVAGFVPGQAPLHINTSGINLVAQKLGGAGKTEYELGAVPGALVLEEGTLGSSSLVGLTAIRYVYVCVYVCMSM